MVGGESSARGMELVTRSEARGLFLVSLGGGMGDADGDAEGGRRGEGGGSGRDSLAAASSHAARAEGSTGHADCGVGFGGGETWLEEVFPMFM